VAIPAPGRRGAAELLDHAAVPSQLLVLPGKMASDGLSAPQVAISAKGGYFGLRLEPRGKKAVAP
jgi:hypothetical protein